jgi:hypothetical protein
MPQLRRHVVTVVLLLSLAVGAQLAFTDVGQEIGPHWSDPAALSTLSSGESTGYVGLASDGGADGGAVAWIERDGETHSVRVASVTVAGGEPTIDDGSVRTVATAQTELDGVDVARAGDRVAVVWESVAENRVLLLVDGETRVVSTNESSSVNYPSVAFVDGTPTVAFQEYYNGSWVAHVATVPADGAPDRVRLGTAVTPGAVSPSIAATDGGAAVGWINTENGSGHVTSFRIDDGGLAPADERSLGPARSVSTMSGTGQLASVTLDEGADGPVVLWTDLGEVNVLQLGGGAAEAVAVGQGKNPDMAASDDQWLATMVVSDRSSGSDIAYALGDGSDPEIGPVSRLPSNAVESAPFYGQGAAAAWTESGGTNELLVSAYRDDGASGPVSRLTAAPTRFLFIGLTAAVVGLVTVPLMPWVVGPLLAGFLLTTRTALDILFGAVARVANLAGRNTSVGGLRRQVREVPPIVPVALFAAVNVALFVHLAGGGRAVADAIAFANPLGVSALGAVAALVVGRLYDVTSGWQMAAVFGYCQTVAAWATALPLFM